MSHNSLNDDFTKYEAMCNAGESPKAVYQQAKADGLLWVACIRMLRQLFQLSLVAAKEVAVVGDGLANSLDEYQGKLADSLEKFLASEEDYPE